MSSGNGTLALTLVRRGATLNRSNAESVDVLALAVEMKMDSVVAEILSFGHEQWLPLHPYLVLASSEGLINMVKTLLSFSECDINGSDLDGTTALMAACARGQSEVVNFLLAQTYVNTNIQNIDGHTALMFANNGVRF